MRRFGSGALAGRPAVLHEAGLALFSALYGRDLAADNDLLPAIGFDGLDLPALQRMSRAGCGLMGRYLVRRLIFSAVLVLGVSVILFALINAIGNPIEILLAERPGISDEMIASMTKYYGLDGNIFERYFTWLWAILHFDFGTSIIYNQPVGDMLLDWGMETLKIQVPAILIALALAVAAAVLAATRQGSRLDFGVISGAMLGHSLPGFFVGILLILVFSYWLGVLPSYGAYSTRAMLMNSALVDGLWHMVLPVAMLAIFNTATLTLLARSSWSTCCGTTTSPRRVRAGCRNGGW